MINDIEDYLYDSYFPRALGKIGEFESRFRPLEPFEASFLLLKIGKEFTNPEILTLLFRRGARMTTHFVNVCLRSTLSHKKCFTNELTQFIASHFAQDQMEDALIWFDSDTGVPVSGQHRYEEWVYHFSPLPQGIVPEFPTFRANPDACATESSFCML
jgi:hypothetical protein